MACWHLQFCAWGAQETWAESFWQGGKKRWFRHKVICSQSHRHPLGNLNGTSCCPARSAENGLLTFAILGSGAQGKLVWGVSSGFSSLFFFPQLVSTVYVTFSDVCHWVFWAPAADCEKKYRQSKNVVQGPRMVALASIPFLSCAGGPHRRLQIYATYLVGGEQEMMAETALLAVWYALDVFHWTLLGSVH